MKQEFGQLSHWWNGTFEQIKGYYCSRKYNGWSVISDGGITKGKNARDIPWFKKDKDVISTGLWTLGRSTKRNNSNTDVLNAPEYFINKLPKGVPVHGEVWYNDRIDIIKQVCGTKKWFDPMWANLKFMAFNMKPYSKWENDINHSINIGTLLQPEYINRKYSEVYDDLISLKESLNNNTFDVVTSVKLLTIEDLRQMQETSIKHNWEGLMFTNPDGLYECGRSYNSLKWKTQCETEGIVIGYENGKTGKNIGKIGSIKANVLWDEQVLSVFGGDHIHVGKEAFFSIGGLNENEHDNCKELYPIGSKIKFSFYGVSIHGVPQSCNIYRE